MAQQVFDTRVLLDKAADRVACMVKMGFPDRENSR